MGETIERARGVWLRDRGPRPKLEAEKAESKGVEFLKRSGYRELGEAL